jgi:hypothetical protein
MPDRARPAALTPRLLGRGAAIFVLCLIAGVYGCDAGHGFVKDDFAWIATWHIRTRGGLIRQLASGSGFFRPLVSLSFIVDHAIFGLAPLGYGLTNLALLLACVGMLYLFFRAVGLRAGVAAGAALVWALNYQGINMAVLWISGRTALMVTLWAVAAAYAWARGLRATAALFAMLAMWSKEEGFVVPAILTAWALIEAGNGGTGTENRAMRAVRETWLLWVVTAASLAARTWSGALTPASAPPWYRYQLDPATLAGNALAYMDRSATMAVLTLLVFWLAAGCARVPLGNSSGLKRKGTIWLLLGFAPTILLPIRSSLYAVFPSVGAVLVAGDLAERIAARAPPDNVRRAVIVLLLLLVALLPVYHSRNRRYVREAELSTVIMGELLKIAASSSNGGLVAIRDVRDAPPTAEQAFGTLANEAALLMTNGKIRLWIDPPPAELAGATPPDIKSAIAVMVVEHGQVERDR